MKIYSANKKSLQKKIVELQLFLESNHGRYFEHYYTHIDSSSARPELERVFKKLNQIVNNIKKGELKHGTRI